MVGHLVRHLRERLDAAATPIFLIGAGGHGRVLWTTLCAVGTPPCAATDADPAKAGQLLAEDGRLTLPGEGPLPGLGGSSLPILGDDAVVLEHFPEAALVLGIGVRPARGDAGTELRQRIHDAFLDRDFALLSVVDPSATVRGTVKLEPGCQILAGAIVQTGCQVGRNAVVNTGAAMDHDCSLDPHAFLAPGAVLCGDVRVGAGAFIGAGALVLPGVSIGKRAVVNAGAVVRRTVPDNGFVE